MKRGAVGITIVVCGLVACPLSIISIRAFAEGAAAEDSTSVDSYYIDFAIPDLAAYTLLGVGNNVVSRPGGIKELSASLLQTATAGGTIAPGVAIEWSPAQTLGSRSLLEYKQWRDALSISIATVQDTSGTRFAWGFRWVPVDRSNPLTNEYLHRDAVQLLSSAMDPELRRELLKDALKTISAVTDNKQIIESVLATLQPRYVTNAEHPVAVGVLYEDLLDILATGGITVSDDKRSELRQLAERSVQLSVPFDENILAARKRRFRAEHWNAASLQLVAGGTSRSADSKWKSLTTDEYSVFAGMAYPLKTFGQVIIHAQGTWIHGDRPDHSRYSVGGRALVGNSKHRASLEGMYTDAKSDIADRDGKASRYTLGFEFKLGNGLWLELAAGAQKRVGEDAADVLTLGNLKYALQRDRRFDIP